MATSPTYVPPESLEPLVSDDQQFCAATVALKRRRTEALRLYRPLPHAMPFHLSGASERLLRGGNQASKTMAAAAEFASAATGIALTGPNEEPIPFRYPRNRPLLLWVTGYDQKHIGGTIFSKLFRPGAFDVITDLETGLPRTWKPWLAEDRDREGEAKPADPLIPERLIKEWAWENKAERVFSVCRLQNGTEIRAFTSGGPCPQGQHVDVIWIDEDIQIPSHVSEWRMRQGRCRGRFWWSVWPHSANNALIKMVARAEEQQDREKPDIEEIVLQYSQNPYIPEDEKRRILEGYTPEERRSRDRGEFLTDTFLVFPEFGPDLHCLPSRIEPDRLEKFLAEQHWQIPTTWTNYLVLDPGHRQPAVLFASVPPPEQFGRHVVVWDEIYTPRVGENETAKEVKLRVRGRYFEAFLIDGKAGRQTSMGLTVGQTVEHLYTEAFRRHGIRSRTTGSGFIRGSTDVPARNMIVRKWMERQEGGGPILRLIGDRTAAMQLEFGLYKKRITRRDITDKVVDRDDHLMGCIGYLAAYDPQYVQPPEGMDSYDPVIAAWRKMEQSSQPKEGYAWMGPGPNPETKSLVTA